MMKYEQILKLRSKLDHITQEHDLGDGTKFRIDPYEERFAIVYDTNEIILSLDEAKKLKKLINKLF